MIPLGEHIPKILLASIIGFVVGIERATQKNKKPVGVGTCSLICLITCALTVTGRYMLGTTEDAARLISGIMTATSFLCGGVIFVKSDDNEHDDVLVGTTTGTVIFGLACIGIMIGLGYWQFASVVTLLVLIILKAAKIFKKYLKNKNNIHS